MPGHVADDGTMQAAYLVSQGKVYDAFQAFIAANQQQLAYELVVDKLVPDAILREDLELLRNLFSQFDPEAVDGWAMKGKVCASAACLFLCAHVRGAVCRLCRDDGGAAFIRAHAGGAAAPRCHSRCDGRQGGSGQREDRCSMGGVPRADDLKPARSHGPLRDGTCTSLLHWWM